MKHRIVYTKPGYALSGLILFLLGILQTVPAIAQTKKFIELGWDIPSTQFIRDHYQEMEAGTPFSGVMYEVTPHGENDNTSSRFLFSPDPWNRKDYQTCIDDLNSCHFQAFTDNFIRANFTPGTVAWDDDAAWETMMQKIAICAWIARETGSKGLAPDFESYGTHMFRWDPVTQNGRNFNEMRRIVRHRGEQFVQAIASEYPDATLLALWLNSINRSAGMSDYPDSVLASSDYGLLPAFINGMIAAAPKEMVFIDGCENGYYCDSPMFYQYATEILLRTGACMKLVEPELRQKYREQVQCGFGIYLDMYTVQEGQPNYRGPIEERGMSRLDRLCDCIQHAMNASDQYIWIYGEQNRWWNFPENDNPDTYWEKALPGLTKRLHQILKPETILEETIELVHNGEAGNNLSLNPAFDEIQDGKPLHWNFWQNEEHPTGEYFSENLDGNNVVSFRNLTNGCVMQGINVKPGERYYFQVRVRTGGNTQAKVEIGWQNSNGWVWEYRQDFIPSPDDNTEWKTVQGVVTTPQNITTLIVLLEVSRQNSPADTCSFDDMEIYRLP